MRFLILLTLLSGAHPFLPSQFLPRTPSPSRVWSDPSPPEEVKAPSEPPVKVPSFQKELTYDELTGRFFEASESEVCDPERGDEYCAVDKSTGKRIRLTTEEKERIYLDAVQSYYYSGRELLLQSEFDLLKEDLQWSGSPVVVLNRKEARFLAAQQAYLKGEPVMGDEEFDELKRELKEESSKIAVSKEPKCIIDTGICTVTLQQDSFRSNLLYLPLGLIFTLLWTVISYEFFALFHLYLNPLVVLLLGGWPIYKGTEFVTDGYVFQDSKIAFGPCPSCGAENRVYFGDILGVKGFDDVAGVKCDNCKIQFKVQRDTLRASTVPKAN
ncbi:hypothetical protein TrLO_g460 [Triparma laevis f. longispina]|uniref:PGR5-like protein 1A, chloroplastic n=1 Tax=Triparma laevis f. longispina TaxID=1714387 RepID=A0A9W7FLB3_9STRA|nr:hypothetical protein TrLO_g460 [Triparma laevis f. longispina]